MPTAPMSSATGPTTSADHFLTSPSTVSVVNVASTPAVDTTVPPIAAEWPARTSSSGKNDYHEDVSQIRQIVSSRTDFMTGWRTRLNAARNLMRGPCARTVVSSVGAQHHSENTKGARIDGHDHERGPIAHGRGDAPLESSIAPPETVQRSTTGLARQAGVPHRRLPDKVLG
jgi:hypothetical protein